MLKCSRRKHATMLPIEVLMMAPDEDEKLVAAFANQCRAVRS